MMNSDYEIGWPTSKIKKISDSKKQLWVVAYVNQDGKQNLVDETLRNIDSSFEGGADLVILINEWCSLKELEDTMAGVRKKHPSIPLGVNYLGHDDEPYGYVDSFRLARDYDLQTVWTDFSGVDDINEKPLISLHDIEKDRHHASFYCSGVHMKYSTLKDPEKSLERSALQAMGWVDGIIITGAKTGVPCDPEHAKRVRKVIGNYPLGVASGVSTQNVYMIAPYMDFFIVSSSLQAENHRIDLARVKELRKELNQF